MEGDVGLRFGVLQGEVISIHALRVEGDRTWYSRFCRQQIFLSTPSGWRATGDHHTIIPHALRFLSTPSGWRATYFQGNLVPPIRISIHALRVEGDSKNRQSFRLFLRKREKNLPL